MSADRRALIALLVAAGMMNIAFTMLVPLVPELTRSFGMSDLAVGLAFAGFALAKAIVQPLGGWLADVAQRRLPELAGAWLLVAAIATAAAGVSHSGTQLVLTRLVWGAAEGLAIPPIYRLLVALGRRTGLGSAKVLGWFGGAAVSGMAVGPMVVGLLNAWIGFRNLFLVGAASTIFSSSLVAVTARAASREVTDAKEIGAIPATQLPRRLVLGLVAVFGMADLVNNALYSALEPVLPLHIEQLTKNAVTITSILFTLGLAVFAVISPISGSLVNAGPPLLIGAAAFAMGAAGLAGQAVSSLWMIYAAFLIFMITQPVLYTVDRHGIGMVPERSLGKVFGLFGLLSDVGFIIGPLAGTLLFAHLGEAVFAVFAALATVMAVMLFSARSFPSRVKIAIRSQELSPR